MFQWSQAYRIWTEMNSSSDLLFKRDILPAYATYVPLLQAIPPKNIPARLIAFYLPQFHEIAENNKWWGEGFTEWTNVKPAQPQFKGHYQPHLPGELGYYNLLDPATQERQVELAKLYGVGGFCFYTYWFGGKLLLEKPIENYLKKKSLDLPFCLCWANENWSRRWDGLESEILISQKHSPEDDLAFIQHVSQYMRDERYIRIDGKPLLLVYRPSLLPSARDTAKCWREWCIQNGIGEIYLAYTQSFETVNPSVYGFDAAIEFPPNNSSPPIITEMVNPLNNDFSGNVYDWRIFVERSRNYIKPAYKLFRGVCPSWDNTARRKNKGSIFVNSSPQGYQEWLSNAVTETCSRIANPDERLIFVNAWNEWAEGAHLEPDQRCGYAYLEATRKALACEDSAKESGRIIIVSHDAHPHGAQYLALNMAREFSQGFGFSVDLVCLGDGVLKNQYAQYARLHDLNGLNHRGPAAHELASNLVAAGHKFAIVNTTVSGFFLETLKCHGIRCVSLIHELRGVLDQYNLHEQAKTIARLADKVVFAAQQVEEEFQEIAPVSDNRRVLRPQGLYKKNTKVSNRPAARQELRKAFKLPLDALIVLGVGYADHRKGIDLFVEAGKILFNSLPNVYLVWLGHWEEGMQSKVERSLAKDPRISTHFIFPGRREDTDLFYAGADVYALTSREDPYPSVVLEAMDSSLPVVGFEGAGGCAELLAVGCGKLVPAFNVNAFSSALEEILKSHDLASNMGEIGQTLIRERFSFRNYLFDLLKQIDYPLQRVSVVVPNYNYACFLVDRIRTIEKQIFPIYELIILDDCSTDESVQVIEEIIQHSTLDIKFVRNDTNSGSVFTQWQKGVELATGDLVWIAEADDLSEPNFLSDVLRGFNNPGVVLSYCESKQISFDGKMLCDNYLDYVSDISRERWQQAYVCDGHNEITQALSVKNTIPNVSAVVFKRDILSDVLKRELEKMCEFKVAGDWYIYTKLLEYGGIAFIPHSANLHRRHAKSVTNSTLDLSQLNEIVRIQRMVASNFLVSNDMQEIARCYTQKLYEQFGLASPKLPNFEQVVLSAES
jgi:glycosyltransferase involved in cell wall biosynthesis